MFNIACDTFKNRLYITLSGQIDAIAGKQIVTKIAQESCKLRRGFDVINDLSEYEQGDPKIGHYVANVMNYLMDQGVGRIIRVVGQSKTALLQFSEFSRSIDHYPVRYVPTLEDAENILDET